MIADLLLDSGARPVIGHRGASGEAPENTIASFDLAIARGAEALELDVRVSRDGVPIVHHDPTLERTTGRPGAIASLSQAEIQEADAGASYRGPQGDHPYRDRGVRVPTLREVLERYPEIPLLVELKVDEAAAPFRAEVARANAGGRVVVASFRRSALVPLEGSGLLVGAARRDIIRHFAAALFGGPFRPPSPVCYAVPYRYQDRIEVPTPRFIRAAHRYGRPVHVWTVDDPGIARLLWDRGVNGIISNVPGTIRRERDRPAVRPGPAAP